MSADPSNVAPAISAPADIHSLQQMDGRLFGESQKCFGCGPNHPHGFHLSFTRTAEGVQTEFIPDTWYQGAPGMMHGGLVTTIADEVAAWAIVAGVGKFGFTTSLTAKFKRPVRVGVPTVARGVVTRALSRMAYTRVEILQQGEECFSAELSFILMNVKQAETMLQQPLPEAWRRFCR